jgi:hypothetical protein
MLFTFTRFQPQSSTWPRIRSTEHEDRLSPVRQGKAKLPSAILVSLFLLTRLATTQFGSMCASVVTTNGPPDRFSPPFDSTAKT